MFRTCLPAGRYEEYEKIPGPDLDLQGRSTWPHPGYFMTTQIDCTEVAPGRACSSCFRVPNEGTRNSELILAKKVPPQAAKFRIMLGEGLKLGGDMNKTLIVDDEYSCPLDRSTRPLLAL